MVCFWKHIFTAVALVFSLVAFVKPTAADSSALTRIAYSANAGVEIFAETASGSWCEEVPGLKLFAAEESAFDTPALTKLMEKTGAVLQKECPRAKQVILDGYSNNTLVYQGSAAKENGWKPEKGLLNVKVVQLQQAAVSSKKAEKSPFSVREWAPVTRKHLAKIDEKTALEHTIYSKDKRCAILYTSDKPASVLKKWYIEVRDNSCSEKLVYGKAEVLLFNEKKRIESVVRGYFTEGRFTGAKNWNALLLNRYGYNKNLQNISYLIDTDFDLKIYYLGYLESRRNPKTGRYSAWKGCDPFVISAVTENEDLFLQNAVTDNILRTAQSFADVFCPSTKNMKFFATTVPRGIPGMDEPESKKESDGSDLRLIYAVSLKKKSGKWQPVSDKTQNLARLRELSRRNEEAREHQLMMADYNDLAKSDKDVVRTQSGLTYKVAELGNMNKVATRDRDSIVITYRASRLSGEEVDPASKRNEELRETVNRLIPGLKEGIKLVGEGGKITLWIPSSLAYGSAGSEEKGIKANEMLRYELEIKEIKK